MKWPIRGWVEGSENLVVFTDSFYFMDFSTERTTLLQPDLNTMRLNTPLHHTQRKGQFMIGTMTNMGSGMTLHSPATHRTPPSGQGQQAFAPNVGAGQIFSSAKAPEAMKAADEIGAPEGNRPPPPPPPSEGAEELSAQSTDQMTKPNTANLFQSLTEGVPGNGSFSLSADSALVESLYNNEQSTLGA
ncbi:hypothetical protein [Aliiruegeria lutimaris]|uniref:Uncharacterized protein n=1 Tax=Aliiruegeria lutimaris TaxID=571298 RepID=A0A1G8LUI2_9RHOB|nr:hypothetical protein [Aliiruegeria lutimaris]SDI59137.1 hypothetical protein SAMN04488026_1004143 [Aliiruegeria lutimaris]